MHGSAKAFQALPTSAVSRLLCFADTFASCRCQTGLQDSSTCEPATFLPINRRLSRAPTKGAFFPFTIVFPLDVPDPLPAVLLSAGRSP